MTHLSTTIAAVATPHGRGGIGIVRISGANAKGLADRLSGGVNCPPRVATIALWRDGDGNAIDRGIQLFFPAPHSYTGEDVVELHGHGNPVLLDALLARLFDLGATPAAAGEFTRRAVANGKMDLSQAEAVAATIDAATLRAARQAQRQLAGEFGAFIDGCMQQLTALLATVEACLDFAEEELPPLTMAQLKADAQTLHATLERSLQSAALGERLFSGVDVAIIGLPNVGKSTLLNALAGRERAIVSSVAGTTRDLLEVEMELNGIPLRLFDTAGLHASSDAIEQEGVRRAHQAAQQADVVLWIADASRPESWKGSIHADIQVMNKMDAAPNITPPEGAVPISAQSGAGLDLLIMAITDRVDDRSLAGEESSMI
ncbi:MAG: tRNA uridine-5-carboxymethylaminomethyl(34) synthesis GTPase MnmE, partial [Mariprofundales bacterium]|nr:tRNA uridine-5-carboxymethylaminomethyl(34) synthesis GTPase MnmE [Mariprofundales bacterium]